MLSSRAQQKQLAPLAVEDAISARAFGLMPISLSRDGHWIAYSLIDPLKVQPPAGESNSWLTRTGAPGSAIGSDVWITNTATSEAKNLTGGEGNSWAPVWSPDGKYLAFLSDRSGRAGLWVWEPSSGKLRRVSDGVVISWRGIAAPCWTADARKILLPVLPQGASSERFSSVSGAEKNEPAEGQDRNEKPTVTVYRAPANANQPAADKRPTSNSLSEEVNSYVADLALIDVASGSIDRVVLKAKPVGYWTSPDSSAVAFTDLKDGGTGMVAGLSYDLTVISVTNGRPQAMAANLKQGGNAVSWSPDGKTLSYMDSKPTRDNAGARADVFLIPVSGGGGPRKATEKPHPNFSRSDRPPVWDQTGKYLYVLTAHAVWKISPEDGAGSEAGKIPDRSLTEIVLSSAGDSAWSPDSGRSIVVITSDPVSLSVGFSRIDLTTGRITKLIEENKSYTSSLSYTAVGSGDGKRVFYIAESAAESPDVWVTDAEFRSPSRLTRVNQQFDKYSMGQSRLIEWRGLDGQKLHGALLLPTGYEQGKRYPLVVEIYNGYPLSLQANMFGMTGGSPLESVDNKQLLATRGYAVLLADTDMGTGTIAQDLVKTLLPGINKTIEMGVADPDRLGVMGFSQGAYGTLAVITQTSVFKAAMMRSGFGNLMSMYGLMNTDGSSQWMVWAEVYGAKMGGTPWEYRARYVENSPIFYLDRVQTPLLIIHGTADKATPPAYADEVFVDLRRLGKETEYAKYAGESHGFYHHANKLDYCARMIQWFDRWLKAPGPSKLQLK